MTIAGGTATVWRRPGSEVDASDAGRTESARPLRPGLHCRQRNSGSAAAAVRPGFLDRRDDSPLRFHFVAAREQRRVAAHRIEQQGLIGRRRLGSESRLVREIRMPRSARASDSRPLRVKCDADAFVRLDAQRDDIGPNCSYGVLREQRLRCALEMDADLR